MDIPEYAFYIFNFFTTLGLIIYFLLFLLFLIHFQSLRKNDALFLFVSPIKRIDKSLKINVLNETKRFFHIFHAH